MQAWSPWGRCAQSSVAYRGDLLVTEQFIHSHTDKGVLEISMNRPARKNALNMSMYEDMAKLLSTSAEDSTVRVVVITGSQQCFTSGNDLQDFIQGGQLDIQDSPLGRFLWALTTYPKPVIAAVDGLAVGIGTTLLLHCDLVYASANSEFKLPFAQLGLCPEYASSFLLPRIAGYVKACEWLLLGQSFNSEQALQGGLLNQIVDDPLAMAHQQAALMAKMPPAALRRTKAMLKAPLMPRVQKVMVAEAEAFVEALQSPEFAEAATAFFEKRAPDFSGF
jgi:enoyl-CoA hydratase/carnithine racemase